MDVEQKNIEQQVHVILGCLLCMHFIRTNQLPQLLSHNCSLQIQQQLSHGTRDFCSTCHFGTVCVYHSMEPVSGLDHLDSKSFTIQPQPV